MRGFETFFEGLLDMWAKLLNTFGGREKNVGDKGEALDADPPGANEKNLCGNQFTGTADNDEMHGTGTHDCFEAYGGDDTIYGYGGNDQAETHNGNDIVYGGAGFDFANGGAGDDTLYGGADHDSFVGGAGADRMYGGEGHDIFGTPGGDSVALFGDTIFGGEGNDEAFGTSQADSIFAGEGFDVAKGKAGDDYISNSHGLSETWGGADDDTLLLGMFIELAGTPDAKSVAYGGTGHDRIMGQKAYAELRGDDGNDTITTGLTEHSTIFGGADDDSIVAYGEIDKVLLARGGSGEDRIVLNLSHGTAYGDDGDDTISAAAHGNAILYGGDKEDVIIAEAGDGVLVAHGDAGEDRILNEGVKLLAFGGSGDDEIMGATDSTLFGGDGEDELTAGGMWENLYGGEGDDVLHGMIDTGLYGGAGKDSIVTGETLWAVFAGQGDDTIHVDDLSSQGEVDGGWGDDLVTMENTSSTAWIQLGHGNDTVFIDGAVDTIFGHKGNDVFAIETAQSDMEIRGGGQFDVLQLHDIESVVDGSYDWQTGSGSLEFNNGFEVDFHSIEGLQILGLQNTNGEVELADPGPNGFVDVTGEELMALLGNGEVLPDDDFPQDIEPTDDDFI